MGYLTVRNEAQKILFEEELSGQISDGMWENTRPYDHWIPWSDATVKVGENLGRTFWVKKDNYNFTHPELLSIVGDRMVEEVQKTIPGYTKADMIRDLKDLKEIVRIRRSESPDEIAESDRRVQARAAEAAVQKQAKIDQQKALKDLADSLGVSIGYIPTTYASDAKISVDAVLRLVDAVRKNSAETVDIAG